jgi:hypothetical protein
VIPFTTRNNSCSNTDSHLSTALCRPVDKDRGGSPWRPGEDHWNSLALLDRIGLGPITAFAMGGRPPRRWTSGTMAGRQRASAPRCKQLVACGRRAGPFACIRGGIVSKQITSFALGAIGKCTRCVSAAQGRSAQVLIAVMLTV